MKIEYITSNNKKFEEAQHILNGWELEQVNLEIPEIQGEILEVIEAKARTAVAILNRPLIVEDVSANCPALGGLPGPYIKDFMLKLGEKGLCDLILRLDDHRISVSCHVAYIEPGGDPLIFEGTEEGIVVPERGETRFGKVSFNSFFQPLGSDKTYGEMSIEELSKMSMRYIALTKLRNHLQKEFPIV